VVTSERIPRAVTIVQAGLVVNIVDGIVGQGLRALVLVTTNESCAVCTRPCSRPGRCAARIEFRAFPCAEAEAWLATRGIEADVSGEQTLASLYARALGAELETHRPVGFTELS
jgi:hypothetical protein